MHQGEHSAILSTFISLPFSIKTWDLSIFKWPLKTGFTVIPLKNKKKIGSHMTVLYPIQCNNELCYKGTSLYISTTNKMELYLRGFNSCVCWACWHLITLCEQFKVVNQCFHWVLKYWNILLLLSLKMLSTKVACCNYICYVTAHANSMDPDQTAPTAVVWSGSSLFVKEASKTFQQTTKAHNLLWLVC